MLQWLRWRAKGTINTWSSERRSSPTSTRSIDELARIVGEAQERDTEDERRPIHPFGLVSVGQCGPISSLSPTPHHECGAPT